MIEAISFIFLNSECDECGTFDTPYPANELDPTWITKVIPHVGRVLNEFRQVRNDQRNIIWMPFQSMLLCCR